VISANDTLGISALDGIAAGCKVIAPYAFAYPEFLPDQNLYTPHSIRGMLGRVETGKVVDKEILEKYSPKKYKENLVKEL